MIDLALDKEAHDLFLQESDLPLVKELDQVEQHFKQRLLFYQGEWFLDITAGLPFFNNIFVKNPNLPNVESIIKAEIVDTPDAEELLEFGSVLTGRHLEVTFKDQTKYGVASVATSIF